jgi:hypothetical protein
MQLQYTNCSINTHSWFGVVSQRPSLRYLSAAGSIKYYQCNCQAEPYKCRPVHKLGYKVISVFKKLKIIGTGKEHGVNGHH